MLKENDMVFGDPNDCAIEVEVTDAEGSWVFGHFLLAVAGETIGNAQDATDLRGCHHWIKRFLLHASGVVDDSLLGLSADEFFARVYDPAMTGRGARSAAYPDAFRKLSISHLGMSSFDRYDVLFVGFECGVERILWRMDNAPAHAHDLVPGQFRSALEACSVWMEQALAGGS